MGGHTPPTDRHDTQQKIQWWSGADTEGRAIHSSWEGQRRLSERGARSLSRLGEEGTPAQRGKRPSRGSNWRLDSASVSKDMVPGGPSPGGLGAGRGSGVGRYIDSAAGGLRCWAGSLGFVLEEVRGHRRICSKEGCAEVGWEG